MATINGTNGNDNLVGTNNDDIINAFKRVAPGIDSVDGKSGIDTLVVDASSEADGVQLSSGGTPTFQVRSNSGDFYVDAYNMERVEFTGGAGNDTINMANFGGSVDGGAGTDYWLADLSAVSSNLAFTLGTTTSIAAADLTSILNIERIDLTTGAGNDTIKGGALADTVTTGAGADTIDARTVIAGGPGDVVDGGADSDTLIVNASSETDSVQFSSGGAPTFSVRSNSGNFYVDAYNMENVQFTGGSANDTINTANHGGSVNGGGGVDFWSADLSAVVSDIVFDLATTHSIAAGGLTSIKNIERINLATGLGNDTITGGSLGDTITTNDGNDTINAGTVLSGGPGDVVNAGAGTDTLIVDASGETDSVSLSSGGAPTFHVGSTSGNFYIDAYDVEKVQFTGGSGNDTFDTAAGGVVVDGGAGTDKWIANLGAMSSNLVFDLGTTTAIAAAGLTSILNIEQIDLTTGTGRDTISGGGFADHIATGDNNDTINARTVTPTGPGDVVDGGAGTDTLIVDASGETGRVQLFSGGTPTFSVRSNSGNFYVDAYNMEKVQFTGGSGNDTINTGNHGGSVDGGAGIDLWTADLSAEGSNLVFALGTTTSISAAGLTSILNLEQINLTTGKGNDTITGGALADNIATGAGNDTINAGMRVAGNNSGDIVDGGGGTDRLVVNAGAETQGVQLFSGGAPTFSVRSNSGNFYIDAYNMEKIQFTSGSGNDSINTGDHGGTINAGAGNDLWTANLGALTTDVTFALATTHAITAAGLTSIQNIEQINLTTGSGNDTITGGGLADSITTGAGNDTIDAGSRVAGSNAIDVADGGADTDTLIVAAGSETQGMQLYAGGAPTFSVRSNSGNFYVDAYNIEKIQFTSGSGNDSVTGGSGDDVLVTGGGHDTLQGGLGQDTLTGGGGSDTFIFTNINDSTNAVPDLITDLTSNDFIDLGAIDADTTVGGDQAFAIVAIFTGHAAQAVLSYNGGTNQTSLLLDTDGDSAANGTILLAGNQTAFNDFLL